MASPSRFIASTAAALVVPLALSYCSSSSTEPKATSLVITPASAVTLTSIGATQRFTAVVEDQSGKPIAGSRISWSSSAPAILSVDTTGLATAIANGSAHVVAASAALTDSVAVTVAQAAAQLTKSSGDLQQGTVGTQLGLPLKVLVRDANATPVPGATVAFATGSGSVGTASATTDASGLAQTTWTLGTTAGTQTATATVTGASGSPATFSATATAGAVAQVTKAAGDAQTTSAGATLPVSPAVLVADAYGNPKAGVSVTFAPTSGSGSVTGGTQVTNAAGTATVGSWTLGAAGIDTLVATVSGAGITGNPAKFTATAMTAGAPTTIARYVGDSQTGLVGYALNVRPAVKVTDTNGGPVSGVAVTFAVTGGGGSVSGGSATTNNNGIAQVTNWVVGPAAGANAMTATAAGLSGSPVSFTATGASPTYRITIKNIGPALSAPVQAALDSAVAKWQRIIYRSVAPVSFNFQQCGDTAAPNVDTTVTGLVILAKFDSIDGPGQILGQAGPCGVRTGTDFSALGEMEFDTADVQGMINNNTLAEVMLHEMGHVIGFGTLWGYNNNCLQLPSSPPSTIQDTYFQCPLARAAFDSIGGLSYTGASLSPPGGNKVPVENCGSSSPSGCGTGTVNSHWREPVFGNELMTGYIQNGGNPLSILTVASIGDLGYTVNDAAADAYTHAFTAPAAGGASLVDLSNDIRRGPILVLDPSGRVLGTVPRR
jgi:hypothetical protein